MSWTDCELGEVVTLKRGHDLPNAKRKEGEIPVVSSSGITGWHNEAKAEPPGVVTGRYGTIGEVFYLDRPFWPLNTALYAIDYHGNDPRFVAYFLRNQLKNYRSEKAAVPGVDRNVLHKIKVRCPDRQTQSRIVSILSAYDDLIENNRRRIALLEQAARMLYREWFVHFRFPGHETATFVDGLPEGWERLPLGALCSLRGGNTFKPKYQGRTKGEVPFIKVGDMNSPGNGLFILEANNWVEQAEIMEMKGKPFSSGDCVFAKIGEALKQNRVRLLARDTLIDNNMMGAIPNHGKVSSEFLYFLLSSYDLASHASGAAVPFLSAKVLADQIVIVPPRPLIEEFDTKAAAVLLQVQKLTSTSVALTRARDHLLPRLMDGRISIDV